MGRHVPREAIVLCKHCEVGSIPTLSTKLFPLRRPGDDVRLLTGNELGSSPRAGASYVEEQVFYGVSYALVCRFKSYLNDHEITVSFCDGLALA